MQYILLVQSAESARTDAPPFIPDSLIWVGFNGVAAYGPYDTQREASDKIGDFPRDRYNLAVLPLHSLSEELDNPAGHFNIGLFV